MESSFRNTSNAPVTLHNADARRSAVGEATARVMRDEENIMEHVRRHNLMSPMTDKETSRRAQEFGFFRSMVNGLMHMQRSGIAFATGLMLSLLTIVAAFYVFLYQNTVLGSVINSIQIGAVLQPMDYFVPQLLRDKINQSIASYVVGPNAYCRALAACEDIAMWYGGGFTRPRLLHVRADGTETRGVAPETHSNPEAIRTAYIDPFFSTVLLMSHFTLRMFAGSNDSVAVPAGFDIVDTLHPWIDRPGRNPQGAMQLMINYMLLLVRRAREVDAIDNASQRMIFQKVDDLMGIVHTIRLNAQVTTPPIISHSLTFILVVYFFFLYVSVTYSGVGVYTVVIFPIVSFMSLSIAFFSFWLGDPFSDTTRFALPFAAWRAETQHTIAKYRTMTIRSLSKASSFGDMPAPMPEPPEPDGYRYLE